MYDYAAWNPKRQSDLPDDSAIKQQGLFWHGMPVSQRQLVAKRSFDVSVSFIALTVLLPFLLLICLAIWLESGRPIIFRQKRGGLHGEPFTILKFRTMSVVEDGTDVLQVRRQDPRVTRLGAILRKTSIDELPQLWNVLRGDMSIVGPRPHAILHDEQFSSLLQHYSERQLMKPGITGLAQCEGWRGETAAIESLLGRVDADIRYIRQWSFWLDLRQARIAWVRSLPLVRLVHSDIPSLHRTLSQVYS